MTVLSVGDLYGHALEPHAPTSGDRLRMVQAATLDSACIRLVREDFDCVLVAPQGASWDALDVLSVMQRRKIRVPVIVILPGASAADCNRLLQAGAQQCIPQRITLDRLADLVESAVELYKAPSTAPYQDASRKTLIGDSPAMQEVRDLIRLVAQRRSTVLITGETGTGKELAARAIHLASDRKQRDMVSVNCASLPDTLLEAELFGHTRGAFTGAVNQRVGRFELAHQSTIFLDEIAEMPIDTQSKLLRVLQEKEIQRIGSSDTIGVDVRVIAATNVDLRAATRERRFREDLLYRLRVVELRMPALRERLEDVPMLTDHLVEKICRREGLPTKCVAGSAHDRLANYSWPGNVRELENVVESACVLSGDRTILDADDFDLAENCAPGPVPVSLPAGGVDFERFMASVEIALLGQALRRADGNKARAADMLRIPRTTLISKVKSLRFAC